MICPLLCIGDFPIGTIRENPSFECLKEGCAWYYTAFGQCAVFIFASRLEKITNNLDSIANGLRK